MSGIRTLSQLPTTVLPVVGGTSIVTMLFRCPTVTSDPSLEFAMDVFSTADYSGSAVESRNTATAQTYLTIFNGTAWVAFPSGGVGNPYYEKRLSVALQSVVSGTQYYVRYKWFVHGSTIGDTPWNYTEYPALETDLPYIHPTVVQAKRVATSTDVATSTINVGTTDIYELTAVANATTFATTGTPTDGQSLIIRFKDAGVAKGLTWNAIFVAIGTTLPTTTVAGKLHYIGCQYNSGASKFHVIAVGVQA